MRLSRMLWLVLSVPAVAEAQEAHLIMPGSACVAADGFYQTDMDYYWSGDGSIRNDAGDWRTVTCPLVAELVTSNNYPYEFLYLTELYAEVYSLPGPDPSCTIYVCDRDGSPCDTETQTADDYSYDLLTFADWQAIDSRPMFLRCSLPDEGRVLWYGWTEEQL